MAALILAPSPAPALGIAELAGLIGASWLAGGDNLTHLAAAALAIPPSPLYNGNGAGTHTAVGGAFFRNLGGPHLPPTPQAVSLCCARSSADAPAALLPAALPGRPWSGCGCSGAAAANRPILTTWRSAGFTGRGRAPVIWSTLYRWGETRAAQPLVDGYFRCLPRPRRPAHRYDADGSRSGPPVSASGYGRPTCPG